MLLISNSYVRSGVANSMHPLSWGAQTEKIQTSYSQSNTSCTKLQSSNCSSRASVTLTFKLQVLNCKFASTVISTVVQSHASLQVHLFIYCSHRSSWIWKYDPVKQPRKVSEFRTNSLLSISWSSIWSFYKLIFFPYDLLSISCSMISLQQQNENSLIWNCI